MKKQKPMPKKPAKLSSEAAAKIRAKADKAVGYKGAAGAAY